MSIPQRFRSWPAAGRRSTVAEGRTAELDGKSGFQKLEEAGLIRFLLRAAFLTTDRPETRTDPSCDTTGGPTYGFPDRGSDGTPAEASEDRLPRRHGLLV